MAGIKKSGRPESVNKMGYKQLLALSIEKKAKKIFLDNYPEFSYLISFITFPKDANIYPTFHYEGILENFSSDTLSFLSGMVETAYEEARCAIPLNDIQVREAF